MAQSVKHLPSAQVMILSTGMEFRLPTQDESLLVLLPLPTALTLSLSIFLKCAFSHTLSLSIFPWRNIAKSDLSAEGLTWNQEAE